MALAKAPLRIVFLAMDDEFAGEMQRFLYERHPDWITGSVISAQAVSPRRCSVRSTQVRVCVPE